MKDLLGDNASGGGTNPMASLFGGNAPFPSGGMPGVNPSSVKPSAAQKPNDGFGFNVDDLVKHIDAKIAALEEEERLEKENANQNKIENNNREEKIVNDIDKDTIKTNDNNINEDNSNNTKVNTSIDDITDDEFFDDFFNDED